MVIDDGQGFDPAEETDGNGLASMTVRAERLGATLTVVSRPGAGTDVRVAMLLGRDRRISGRSRPA